ncbi:MAG: FecR family protein [Chloroflexi bacterium]|nr:FecR family protein [Chloroflexota bacterium]
MNKKAVNLKRLLIYGACAVVIVIIALMFLKAKPVEQAAVTGSLVYTSGKPEIKLGILGWSPLEKGHEINLPGAVRTDESPITIIKLSDDVVLRLGSGTEVRIEAAGASIGDLPSVSLVKGRLWIDKPEKKLLTVDVPEGSIFMFGSQAEFIATGSGSLVYNYRGKAALKSGDNTERLPISDNMIAVVQKGQKPALAGNFSSDDLDIWRAWNLNLNSLDVDNISPGQAADINSSIGRRDEDYLAKYGGYKIPDKSSGGEKISDIGALDVPEMSQPAGTAADNKDNKNNEGQAEAEAAKDHFKGLPPQVSFRETVRRGNIPTGRPVNQYRQPDNIQQQPTPPGQSSPPSKKSEEEEKLYTYNMPSSLSDSGLDELPDNTPVPWARGGVDVVDSEREAEEAFDLVRDNLREYFNMKLNYPYRFTFVPKNDTSILKGSMYKGSDEDFDESSIQVAGYDFDKKTKQHVFYLLEGLEKHESHVWLAQLIATAWMEEYVPKKIKTSLTEAFINWVAFKLSYKMKEYYNARSTLDGQYYVEIEKMRNLEAEHGERGVFDEITGKTSYLKNQQ